MGFFTHASHRTRLTLALAQKLLTKADTEHFVAVSPCTNSQIVINSFAKPSMLIYKFRILQVTRAATIRAMRNAIWETTTLSGAHCNCHRSVRKPLDQYLLDSITLHCWKQREAKSKYLPCLCQKSFQGKCVLTCNLNVLHLYRHLFSSSSDDVIRNLTTPILAAELIF